MAAAAHFLSLTITKLELLCRGLPLGVATGFFMKRDGGWAIATTWHALSGRDPRNGQPRHSSGAVPDVCRFHTAEWPEGLGAGVMQWRSHDIPLGDAVAGSAAWLQHPEEGQAVDVAVLPLPHGENVGKAKDLLDPTGHDEDMFIDLGAELFLPGYPLGISAAGNMAIWKRASLASSLEFGAGIKRAFLVDTATREGMSGAPCLAVANWRYYRLARDTGKMSVSDKPLSWRLLGVYAGRINASDSFEAQLGIVWRENLVMDTLRNNAAASVTIS